MKKIIALFSLFPIILVLTFSTGCKQNSVQTSDVDSTHFPPNTRKPNIYIYPTTTCSLSVKIEFPVGGTITKSEPEYKDGWNIKVEPSGKINDKYDYLFYECRNPDLYQYNSGWVVSRDTLFEFFSNNLSAAGFNANEINDFTEYWISRLVEYPYYIIYPQLTNDIEKVIRLKFSIAPDNILRLFYAVKGTNNPDADLEMPVITKFKREGFVVAEWGVVI